MAGESKQRHRLEGAGAQQCGCSCLTKLAYELIPSPEKRSRNWANTFSVSLSSAYCTIQTSQLPFFPGYDKRCNAHMMFSTPGSRQSLPNSRSSSAWLPLGSEPCTGGHSEPPCRVVACPQGWSCLSHLARSVCCAGLALSPAGPGPCC